MQEGGRPRLEDGERADRHEHPVADASDLDDDLARRAPVDDHPANRADHRTASFGRGPDPATARSMAARNRGATAGASPPVAARNGARQR